MRRVPALAALLAVVAAPLAHADPGPVGNIVATIETVVSKECVAGAARIDIGNISGVALTEPLSGDTYYRWSAPTSVEVAGTCDKSTSNTQVYVDQPIIAPALSRPESSGPYTVTVKSGPAFQAPNFYVLYYKPSQLYERAIIGSITVTVHGSWTDANGAVHTAGCATRSWYFAATPAGPVMSHDSGVVRC